MTHPLTPREKVLLAIYENKGRTSGDLADNILTALASGSGDHAELARLAEAASGSDWQTHIAGRPEYKNVTHYIEQNPPRDLPFIAEVQKERDAAFIAAANPATILALLAENAALRAEHVHLVEQKEGAEDALFNALSRATEAERKLAEALGLVERSIDLMTDEYADTKAYREEVRTFLSKEVERG